MPNPWAALEAEAAIAAAQNALAAWRSQDSQRSAPPCCSAAPTAAQTHTDDLALILTAEQGKPLAEARGEVTYGGKLRRVVCRGAKRVYGETIPSTDPSKRYIVLKQAIGVCAAITPWNFPLAMITRKVAPALAAGCPSSSNRPRPRHDGPGRGRTGPARGMPAGVLNVLTADAAVHRIGHVLCERGGAPPVLHRVHRGGPHPDAPVRRHAEKDVSLELGGNAPFIVFDDADLDAAVSGAVASKYRNAGQTCVCANRLYVQAGIYDAFVAKFAAKVATLKPGPGLGPAARSTR